MKKTCTNCKYYRPMKIEDLPGVCIYYNNNLQVREEAYACGIYFTRLLNHRHPTAQFDNAWFQSGPAYLANLGGCSDWKKRSWKRSGAKK